MPAGIVSSLADGHSVCNHGVSFFILQCGEGYVITVIIIASN